MRISSHKITVGILVCLGAILILPPSLKAGIRLKYQVCAGYIQAVGRYNTLPSLHQQNAEEAFDTIARFRFNGLQAPDPWHASAARSRADGSSLYRMSPKIRQKIANRIAGIEFDWTNKTRNGAFFMGKSFKGRAAIEEILSETEKAIDDIQRIRWLSTHSVLRRGVNIFIGSLDWTFLIFYGVPIISLPLSPAEVPKFLLNLLLMQRESLYKMIAQIDGRQREFLSTANQLLNASPDSVEKWIYRSDTHRLLATTILSLRNNIIQPKDIHDSELSNSWSMLEVLIYFLQKHQALWREADHIETDKLLTIDTDTGEPVLTILFRIFKKSPNYPKPEAQTQRQSESEGLGSALPQPSN